MRNNSNSDVNNSLKKINNNNNNRKNNNTTTRTLSSHLTSTLINWPVGMRDTPSTVSAIVLVVVVIVGGVWTCTTGGCVSTGLGLTENENH